MDDATKARFWAKVEKSDGCWEWKGAMCNGYGHVRIDNKDYKAHRLSLEWSLGRPIQAGLVVAHQPIVCNNKACVNPSHLREATRSENALDCWLDGTMNRASGRDNGTTRSLTDEQVRAVRLDTRFQRIIAEEYGVTQTVISNIKTRKRYAWVI
jgi:hypothetical protein